MFRLTEVGLSWSWTQSATSCHQVEDLRFPTRIHSYFVIKINRIRAVQENKTPETWSWKLFSMNRHLRWNFLPPYILNRNWWCGYKLCNNFSSFKFPLSQVQKKFHFKEKPVNEWFLLYMGFSFGQTQKIFLRHRSGCGFYQAWHPVANGVVSPRLKHAHHIHSIRVWHNKFLQ